MRYLGVTIDHKLTFLPHIINLEAKLSRNVGSSFKRIKHLPTSALTTRYYALVHPFLFYGIINVWGSTNKSFFTKLRSLQNKALKAIGHLGWHASPKHLCSRFKILKLDDVYRTELSKFVQRFISKILRNIDNYYTKFKKINKHDTRSSSH